MGFGGQVKCLGLTLDSSLSFLSHTKGAGNRANAVFGKVIRLARLGYGVRPGSCTGRFLSPGFYMVLGSGDKGPIMRT